MNSGKWYGALHSCSRWHNKGFARRFVHRNMGTARSGMWNVAYRAAYREAQWKYAHEREGHWICMW